jgi:hypothetical protein
VRIRTIKPEFWQDETVGQLPFLTRLVFVALWNESDDEGRLRGNPIYLKSVLFPYDNFDMREHIDSLKSHGMISEYSVRAQTYLHVVNFRKHQRINRPSASKFPGPKEAEPVRVEKTKEKKRSYKPPEVKSVSIHGGLSESSVKCSSGKEQGKEGEQGTGKLPAKKPGPSSDYTSCVAAYYELYESQSGGRKPRWGGKAGKQLKDLLGSYSAVEVIERMEYMFAGKSWLKPPYTFGSLVTNWDALVPAKKNGKGGISGDDLREMRDFLIEQGE